MWPTFPQNSCFLKANETYIAMDFLCRGGFSDNIFQSFPTSFVSFKNTRECSLLSTQRHIILAWPTFLCDLLLVEIVVYLKHVSFCTRWRVFELYCWTTQGWLCCLEGQKKKNRPSARPRSHRTRKQICMQICVQTLWCCVQPVWTLLFTTVCSASCVNGAQARHNLRCVKQIGFGSLVTELTRVPECNEKCWWCDLQDPRSGSSDPEVLSLTPRSWHIYQCCRHRGQLLVSEIVWWKLCPLDFETQIPW